MEQYFNKDGVQYTVEGEYEKAFHIAVTQMAMLEMSNVNKLPQVQSERILDDGTRIQCSIIHGVKQTKISVPLKEIEEKPKEEKEKKKKEYYTDQTVPIIVVTDESEDDPGYHTHYGWESGSGVYSCWRGNVIGFIACLSGTFEGPYVFFQNTFELPYCGFHFNCYTAELENSIAHETILSLEDNKELLYLKPDGEYLCGDDSLEFVADLKKDCYNFRYSPLSKVTAHNSDSLFATVCFVVKDVFGGVNNIPYFAVDGKMHAIQVDRPLRYTPPACQGVNHYSNISIASSWYYDTGGEYGIKRLLFMTVQNNKLTETVFERDTGFTSALSAVIPGMENIWDEPFCCHGEVFMGTVRTYVTKEEE